MQRPNGCTRFSCWWTNYIEIKYKMKLVIVMTSFMVSTVSKADIFLALERAFGIW